MSVLPVPPFGPSTQIERCAAERAGLSPTRLARERLLQGEQHLVGGDRQHHDVVGAGREDATGEAVRRAVREHDDGPAGPLGDGVVDQVEGGLGLPGAGDDQQVVRGLVESHPRLVDPVTRPTISTSSPPGSARSTSAWLTPASRTTNVLIGSAIPRPLLLAAGEKRCQRSG